MAERSRLRQFVLDYFSDDELEDLTFDYFPDVQRLFTARMNKSQKVRELIDFADRRGRIDHLMAALERARPEAYCEFFSKPSDEPPPAPAPTAPRDPQKVFISYANPDQDFAHQLAEDMRDEGFDLWIAPDSIQPGEKWVDAINRGLMESGVFLLVLTPDAVNSKWVYDETSVAIALENKNQMRFLSLSVKPADAPPLWAIRQHISFEGNYERGFRSLLAALRPAKTAMLRPLPAPPPLRTEAPPVSPDRPALVIDWPGGRQQTFALDKALTRVGRAPLNDLVLDFAAVSNAHLLVQIETAPGNQKIRVMDLGSTNGTYLNGRRLPANSAHLFDAGDRLQIGDPAGPALAITLKKPTNGDAAIARGQPAPVVEVNRASVAPIAPVVFAQPHEATPAGAGTRRGLPKWLPVVGVLVLLGAAVAAFLIFGNGDPNEEASGDGAATVGVQLPTNAPTEAAVAALVPTATTAPTATVEPTELPTATPTAEPTETPPPTATAAATEPPTATAPPPTSAPAVVAANTVALGPDTVLDFEAFGLWTRGDQENGTLTQSSVESRGGRAARLDYDFPGAGNDFVVFLQEHAITGEPNAIRLWVYGDNSGHFLNAWVLDSQGQTWQAPFGQILHNGWRQMTALIDTDQEWPWTHISGTDNGEIDYPIRLRGLVLDDRSADFTGEGTIYLDDLTVATVEGVEVAATGTTATATEGDAAESPPLGALGSIFFTAGGAIYTTDPAWASATQVGAAEANTCFSEAKTVSGASFSLDAAPYCNIGGGPAVCASPNGQYEVLVGTTPAGRSILVRQAATDGGNFVYDGAVDVSEGILWSPTSASFLFVVEDTVNQAFPDGNRSEIITSAYSPQFSPDGGRILFIRVAGGSRDVYIWSATAGETNLSKLGLADMTCPRWAAGS